MAAWKMGWEKRKRGEEEGRQEREEKERRGWVRKRRERKGRKEKGRVQDKIAHEGCPQ